MVRRRAANVSADAIDEKTGSSLYSRIGTTHMSTLCLRISAGRNVSRRCFSHACCCAACSRSVPNGRSAGGSAFGASCAANRTAAKNRDRIMTRRSVLRSAVSWRTMTALRFSRRQLLQTLGAATVGAPLSALAQGRCMTTYGAPSCNTSDVPPIFAPTGWKTDALEKITFNMADYRKEAAFYAALMGWTLRSDDGSQAVLDIGDWGSAVFKKGEGKTTVESFSFV